ncbi:FBD-associated F-box protein At5g38590 isoform X2 [Raphanus sativus]|uniref:FBD-associated F-box protein At5g38590 isoform X2 n=1 Tax=Raphanus sativus TaxID=3726 RepID=A0A6J0KH97_RAPSA|nr:FBD-associated F-box protein At5g38590 isoform X2 [Raphanus sativus]
MDKISELPDELLVKILSSVPTKVAVSTSVLSKRWKFLWMWLTKLEYSDDEGNSFLVVRDFINKNLPLHRAPLIERLCLELWEEESTKVNHEEDIKLWVETAVSRCVRYLEVSYNVNMLPSSLFTCESLVVLKLRYLTLKDVPSTGCSLPSLKTLQLKSLTYVGVDSLQNLLSMCHHDVLEEVKVRFIEDEYPQMFTVIFPLLHKLSLSLPDCEWDIDEYEIDTPCLQHLKLKDRNQSRWLFKKNMPDLSEAYVHVESYALDSVIGVITSVKHLTVCSEVREDLYYGGHGFVFHQLEHLELCVCKDDSLNLLAQFLKDSPNLRVLDISILDLSCVPECMLPSLRVFNWSRYVGRPRDRDIAVYILRNAPSLRTATFRFDADVPNLKILKMELADFPPASSTCELMFVESLI